MRDPCPDPRKDLIHHVQGLRAFAISLTRNRALADDMVQDTIVKAWVSMDQFLVGSNMRAWLFTILRNTYYSYQRKRAREMKHCRQLHSSSLVTKPAHDGTLQLRDFSRAFSRLAPAQRETLILLAGAGHTYAEAAAICGVTPNTIKSRARRGRRRLAELMDLDETGAVPLTDKGTLALVGR